MNKKILVVGINPSNLPTTEIQYRKGHTFERLHRWMGALDVDYFSFVNCISTPGEYKMKDVDFGLLNACAANADRVIALGGFVSRALDRAKIPHFTMPHPSSRNRILNDPKNEVTAVESCREYIEKN